MKSYHVGAHPRRMPRRRVKFPGRDAKRTRPGVIDWRPDGHEPTPLDRRSRDSRKGGCLYLVATPIGNLEDITVRALRILGEVHLIACEDTRQTAKLLRHYNIDKKTVSYHEHNEMTRAAELVIQLEEGAKVALVTDAGTPGISDPGHHLISLCLRHHIPIVPIPGPSAVIAALAASGLPTEEFLFVGFLPSRGGERRKALERLASESAHAGALRVSASPRRHAGRRAGPVRQAPGRDRPRTHQAARGISARRPGRTFGARPANSPARRDHPAGWRGSAEDRFPLPICRRRRCTSASSRSCWNKISTGKPR